MKRQKGKQHEIMVAGSELVELKRHAYDIPECPGLDKMLQKYQGDKPFPLALYELEWLVVTLEVVINDPNGYAVIEHNPWKLEYVPKTDERYKICKKLYRRLNRQYDEIFLSLQKGVIK